MAIHAKKINIGSSANMVSFTTSIGATDLQLTETDGVTLYDPVFTTIESVHNFSGGNVSFAGYTFAPGTWKFGEAGGLNMTPQTGAIAGAANCLITIRT